MMSQQTSSSSSSSSSGSGSSTTSEACPTCGARDWEHLFDSRSFAIGRCRSCQLVRTLGVVFDDGDVTYPHFDQSETVFTTVTRFLLAQLLRERARVVEKAVRSGAGTSKPRVLDIGCGSGAFARMMSTRGFKAVGVEPFSLGREVDEPNLTLRRATFESVKEELGTFDVITMWHVLEHVENPKKVLASLLDMLNDKASGAERDGVLVVSVPNFESWQSRLFEGGWFHLDPPRHVTHFNHATLTTLLRDVGYEIEDERTFHFEYGPVGWLQSALNRVLPHNNFLFELIKDRGALKNMPASEMSLNLVLSGLVGLAVGAPSIAVEGLAALRNAGSVITITARPTRKRGAS